jgi:predicted outer membrane protein
MKRLLLAMMLAAGAASAQTDEDIANSGSPVSADEARVAAIVEGANRGALAASGVAGANASDPEVQAFAKHMRMERQELSNAFDALASMRGIPEELPADGEEYLNEGEGVAEDLTTSTGLEADRAFLDYAAASSEKLMKSIDENASAITEPRMANYLRTLRAAAERDRNIALDLKNR